MSHNNPITIRHRDEFRAHMQQHDRPGVSPATRIFDLEDAALSFIHYHGMHFVKTKKAVGQYLRMIEQLTK